MKARLWDATTGQLLAAPLTDETGTLQASAAFSPDGRRLVIGRFDRTHLPWAQVWEFAPDERPLEDLARLAHLYAAQEVDERGRVQAVAPEAVRFAWQLLSARYPDMFTATPAEVVAWHRRRADHARVQALLTHWYRRPADPGLFAARWAGAIDHLNRVLEIGPVLPQDWHERGLAHAYREEWDRADADLARMLAAEPDDLEAWWDYARVLLAAGKTVEYRRFCAELLARFGDTAEPTVLGRVLRVCVLAPDAVADPARLAALAERDRHSPFYGLALYRAGRYEEAARALKGSTASVQLMFRAMALHRLGQTTEARLCLDRALRELDKEDNPRSAFGDVHLWLRRREAEALLGDAGKGPSP